MKKNFLYYLSQVLIFNNECATVSLNNTCHFPGDEKKHTCVRAGKDGQTSRKTDYNTDRSSNISSMLENVKEYHKKNPQKFNVKYIFMESEKDNTLK